MPEVKCETKRLSGAEEYKLANIYLVIGLKFIGKMDKWYAGLLEENQNSVFYLSLCGVVVSTPAYL